MSAHITYEEDVIVLRVTGDQHYEDMIALGKQLAKYAHEGVIDKLLLDLTATGYADIGARLAALRIARMYTFHCEAILRGKSSLNVALTLLIARRSEKVEDIKVFTDRDKAITWLRLQPTQQHRQKKNSHQQA